MNVEPKKHKSTIEFKLTPKAKSPSLWLLGNCILNDCDFGEELGRYCIRPALASKAFGKVTRANVLKALAESLCFDWLALCRAHNLGDFQSLLNGFKRLQLTRISDFRAGNADTAD